MFRHGDHTHEEASVARLCDLGLTFTCSWRYLGFPETPAAMDDDTLDAWAEAWADGPQEIECGAAAWENARGWTCENGHEHVDMVTRAREGWDYAADEGEAYLLRRAGVDAVAMDGTGIASAA